MDTSKFKSLRAFIGAKDFEVSRKFYNDMGFREIEIDSSMSNFTVDDHLIFYLQDAYVKGWVDNTMLFLEVENAAHYEQELKNKKLDEKYPNVRFTEMKYYDWGREFFMHDPSGVLWHFGEFTKKLQV